MDTKTTPEIDDRGLLKQALETPDRAVGRHAASVLLGRYHGRVYSWCLRYVRDHEQALDMAQEVMLNAYRNLDSFAGKSRFSSWLFSITRNRCLSELRRPCLLMDEGADPDDRAARELPPDQGFEERVDEEDLMELIHRLLDPVEQQALWLRCFERMPVEEITAVLGIEEASGARGVLQRARRKLRVGLGGLD